MECIFLNAAGQTLFTRTDMESGHWVQQEKSVNADFPFDPGKVIEIGQRIAFRDPATDNIEVFEIRNVVNTEPDHYQQITAEHIAVSELSDEHINTTEITNKTAAQALATALTGTLWSVGTNTASGTQSADISRGSVWNAISTIQQNWNVYIIPRVVISSAGAITGRYLDVMPAQGAFRGVRLSIRKNLLDPAVTYDDTEVLTALYGYGGNVDVTVSGQDDSTEELTFASVVWTATAEHPAKPSGQTYLEWPEKTAIYGRNGRPRFGYYQNGNIKDASVLLQKTWEALKKTADPKISISGTCVDLYRLGYKDQPLRLHDTAIVEIEETGEVFQKEIIMLDVDLVDPSGSRPEIGDYIPNIIYINRETNEKASGGGGGGGGRGQSNREKEESETFSAFEKADDRIGMVVGTRNGGYYIKAGQIALSINETGTQGSYETVAHINADRIWIGQNESIDADFQRKTLDGTLTAITTDFTTVNTLLAKKIEASDITSDFLYSKITAVNSISANSITAGSITVLTGGSSSQVASQAYVNGCIYGTITATANEGQITLRGNRLGTSGAVNLVTFNIADTQFYKDGVSAAAAAEAAKYTLAGVYVTDSSGSYHLRGTGYDPEFKGTLYYSDGSVAGTGNWFLRGTTVDKLYSGTGTRFSYNNSDYYRKTG